MQCDNCQKYGHIAKNCSARPKCGHCASEHNTRACPGKQNSRFINCSKRHVAWDQACPVRLAAKAKAVQIRNQDPGRFVVQGSQLEAQDGDWQIVGSRKRRAGTSGPQIARVDGENIERRGPGRPEGSTNKIPNKTRAAAMTPSMLSVPISTTPKTPRTVTRESTTEASEAPLCTMTQ
ncbi:hypothetical protein K3495_g5638 [Podosphaera aphanis]|nr:hypothetical protein K3495_g5638 [Podosphaera aphanis]